MLILSEHESDTKNKLSLNLTFNKIGKSFKSGKSLRVRDFYFVADPR